MAQTDPQLNFRCPPDLKQQLETSAVKGERSLNAEIVRRLRDSYRLPADEQVVITADPVALQEAMAFAIDKVLRGNTRPGAPLRHKRLRKTAETD